MPELVSVVIPAHNYAHYLGDAIDSALGQGYEPVEVIAVDDGSTDATPTILNRYAEAVQVIRLDGRGVAEARNVGLARARGVYVIFLDADDLLLPGGIQAQAEYLHRNPDLDAVYGAWYVCDTRTGVSTLLTSAIPPDQVLPRIFMGNVVYTPSAMMVRRRTLEIEGGFNSAVSFTADWELWMRLAVRGCRFGAVREPVAVYRIHGRSMTRNLDKAAHDVWYVLDTYFADPALSSEVKALKDKAYSRMSEYLGKLYLEHGDEARARHLLRRALECSPDLAESIAFYGGIARAMWRRWQVDGRPNMRGAAQAMVDFVMGLNESAGPVPKSRRAVVHLAAGLTARRVHAQRVALYHLGAALRASWWAVVTRHLSIAARLCVPWRVMTALKVGLAHLGFKAFAPDAASPLVAMVMASSDHPGARIVEGSHGHSRP